jgi:integrase
MCRRELALITGQRRDEVARMRWADIDASERTWTLSGTQTKARRAHVVPLSPLAWDTLTTARGTSDTKSGGSPYVFTTTCDTPISGFGKVKLRIDLAATKARKQARLDPLAPWTIHDLRRTRSSRRASAQ